MSTAPFSSISEWAEQDRVAFERANSTFVAAQTAARELTASKTTPDGGITIEVNGNQKLREIRIDRQAYEEYDEGTISSLVIAGIAAAKNQLSYDQRKLFDEHFE